MFQDTDRQASAHEGSCDPDADMDRIVNRAMEGQDNFSLDSITCYTDISV